MWQELHSSKLTWQWKIPIFNREYIFNRSIFQPAMLVYWRVHLKRHYLGAPKATEPELVPEMMSVLSKYPSAPAVLVRAARCEQNRTKSKCTASFSFAMDDLFGKEKSFPKYKLGGGWLCLSEFLESNHRGAKNFMMPEHSTTRWWFQIYVYFHPYLGKISNLTNMFQMGWNHQLVKIWFNIQVKPVSTIYFNRCPLDSTKNPRIMVPTFLERTWGREVVFFCISYLLRVKNCDSFLQWWF